MAKGEVGFIGLGRMGFPMARNLAAAGWTVHAHDVSPDAAKRASAVAGITVLGAPRDVAGCAEHGDAGDGAGALGGVGRDIMRVHGPPGRRQVARHGEAHPPESDEADLALRHEVPPEGRA